jgi:hypothetical protein
MNYVATALLWASVNDTEAHHLTRLSCRRASLVVVLRAIARLQPDLGLIHGDETANMRSLA